MRSYKILSPPIQINTNKCDGCGTCTEICPNQVFEMEEISQNEIQSLSFFGRLKVRIKGNVKSKITNPQNCTSCGKCIKNCHENAITYTY
jgi:NAD-dependent dihydropyrimidine dehydrogenase PreA subunit